MRMRTRSVRVKALSLLAVAALVGAACGGDDDDAAEPADTGGTETSAGGGTTATTAAPSGTTAAGSGTTVAAGTTAPGDTAAATPPPRGDADLVIWSDETRGAVVQELADVFGEENGITVEVQQIPLEDTMTQLTQAAPAGEGPDIFILPHDNLGTLVSNGLVEPLDLGGREADFEEVAITGASYDGQLYGVPYAIENIALFRNTDIVPEEPATWEEMVQIATDFKAEHADDPTYLGIALQIGAAGDLYHYHPVLTAFGGYVFGTNADGSYNSEDVGLDSEGAIAAGTWLKEAAESGILNGDVEYPTMLESFGAGKAAFAITGPWALTDPNAGFKAAGVPYAIGAFPAVEGGEAPSPFVGVQTYFVNSFSENKDLAKSFVQDFVPLETTQLAMFEAGSRPPALTAAFEQTTSDPDIEGFGIAGAAGTPTPAIPAMGAVWTDAGLAQANVARGADPATEFTNAADAIRESIAGG
jgi:maltose-binding protein MalE